MEPDDDRLTSQAREQVPRNIGDTPNPTTPLARSFGDEVDLGPYLWAIGRHWKALIAVASLGGLLGFVVADRLPRIYEATAVLMATPEATAEVRTLLTSNALAAQVVRDIQLDAPPYSFTSQSFIRTAVLVQEVPNTSMIRVSVRLQSASLAADAATALATKVGEFARRLQDEQAAGVLAQLTEQSDHAAARLKSAESRLQQYRQQSRIDLLKEDADVMLRARGDVLDLSARVEGARARVKAIELQLASRSRPATVQPSSEKESSEPTAPGPTTSPRDTLAPSSERPREITGEYAGEYLDTTYASLDRLLAESRADLATLEAQLRRFAADTNTSRMKLLSELHLKEIELAPLEADRDSARRIFDEIAARQMQVALPPGNRIRLTIVDAPVVPDRPLSPRVPQFVFFGSFMFVLMATGTVTLIEWRRRTDVGQ